MEATNKISKFIFTWIIVFAFWLAFTTSLEIEELIVGIVLSLTIAIFSFNDFTEIGLKSFSPKRLLYMVQYFFVFIWALLLLSLPGHLQSSLSITVFIFTS